MIGKLNRIAPLDLLSAIEALPGYRDDSIDRQLLEALPNNPASKTLMIESVTVLFKDRSAEVQDLVQRRWESLSRPTTEIVEALNRLEAELPTGDPLRGFEVFRSAKGACSACHRIG